MAPTTAEDDGARRKRSTREESPPEREGRARYGDANAKEGGARDRYSERDRRHSRRPRDTLPIDPSAGVGTSVAAAPEKKMEREKDGSARWTSFDRADAPEKKVEREKDGVARWTSFDRADAPEKKVEREKDGVARWTSFDRVDASEKKVEREKDGVARWTSFDRAPEKKVEREKDGGARLTSFDRADAPPRSRSYLQHDDRCIARYGGRTNDRRASDHGRWEDSKEKLIDKGEKETLNDQTKKDDPAREKDGKDKSSAKVSEKESADFTRKKNEQNHPPADEKNVWKHDRFYELEVEPPAKRRPPFREKKEFVENATGQMEAEASKPPRPDRSGFYSFRKEDGRGYYLRQHDRYGRPPWDVAERDFHKGEGFSQKSDPPRYGIQPRDRWYSGGASVRGRERFHGRYSGGDSFNSSGVQVEKWKHDMFEDANRSPTPKNEEDQIAKVEALLAL